MGDVQKDKECCPEFHPERWDKKLHTWDKKKFIKDSLPTLFHIPFPPMIDKKITKMWTVVENSGAAAPDKEDSLILFHNPSAFRSDIYISRKRGFFRE